MLILHIIYNDIFPDETQSATVRITIDRKKIIYPSAAGRHFIVFRQLNQKDLDKF